LLSPHSFLESLALALLFALLFPVWALTHDPELVARWCQVLFGGLGSIPDI
jgi:hypothetical protein